MSPETVRHYADCLSRGEITAEELASFYRDRIEKNNDRIRAFVDVPPALAAPRVPPRLPGTNPLAGIPIAIKANRDALGLRIDHGSRVLRDRRPEADHHFVALIRGSGAFIVGSTVCSEFSLLPSCEPASKGPVLNPTNPAHGTGGSSGGAAAAVASMMVPIAHGNDAGGSLRIPAAVCNLISAVVFDSGSGAGEGFIATTVDDVVLACRGLGLLAPPPGKPPQAITRTAAVIDIAPDGTRASVAQRVDLDRAAGALSGWHVEETAPLREHPYLRHRFASQAPPVAQRIRSLIHQLPTRDGNTQPAFDAQIENYTRNFLANAERIPYADHLAALRFRSDWQSRYNHHYQDYSVLISPIGTPPAPGVMTGDHSLQELSSLTASLIAFTWPANTVRWPSISVGNIQFTARPEHCAELVAAAQCYEAARPQDAAKSWLPNTNHPDQR